jgi:hypothetical protein
MYKIFPTLIILYLTSFSFFNVANSEIVYSYSGSIVDSEYFELVQPTRFSYIRQLNLCANDRIRLGSTDYANKMFLQPSYGDTKITEFDYVYLMNSNSKVSCYKTNIYEQEYKCSVSKNKYDISLFYANLHCSYHEFKDCHLSIYSIINGKDLYSFYSVLSVIVMLCFLLIFPIVESCKQT